MTIIPVSVSNLLWSEKRTQMDGQSNSAYLVHQVLRYGTLADIKWLISAYGVDKVKKIFIDSPTNNYSKAGLHFVVKTILRIEQNIDERAYVQSFY